MRRVAIWNDGIVPKELGGGTRGNDTFKPTFDLALLSEEVKEFYKAMAKNDLVEMFDAVADMKFVWEGIEFKYGCTSYSYTASSLDEFYNNERAFNAIRSYYFGHFNTVCELLYKEVMNFVNSLKALPSSPRLKAIFLAWKG